MPLINWFASLQSSGFRLYDDDIVVFVVGPSGSGKSLFVHEVTRNDLVRVGNSLRPRTARVQPIRCGLTPEARATLSMPLRNIVFVDTPSFHTGERDGLAERELKNWLIRSRYKSTLVGVIYMHRVETDPACESIQQHLNAFAYAFPPGLVPPERVHAVLSYEGMMSEGKIQHRREAFQTQLSALRPSLGPGGRVRWDTSIHPDLFRPGDCERAWQAVVELFSRHTGDD